MQPEDRLTAFFESSAIPMYLVDPVSLRFLAVNDAMLQLYGYTRDELLATTTAVIRPPEDVPALRIAMANAVAGQEFQSLWRHIRKNGTSLHVHVYPHRMMFEGRPVLLVTLFDVTEQLRVENALRESEERYRTISAATSDAVWDLDLVTNEVFWNESFSNLFGYRSDEMGPLLDWWEGQLHPDDRSRVMASLDAAVRGNTALNWEEEYRFRRANGSYARVLDRGIILRDESGKATRAIGAMVDVTAQREMQGRLALANRMASVGTLAAGMAHEINNPLGWILANLDEALDSLKRAGDPASATTASLLEKARDGAERVRSIVRDLRSFSRTADEPDDLVDVRAVVESAGAMASNEIRHRARLVVEIPSGLPPMSGSSSKLGQVFVNLLVNAAQAIPEGDASRHEIRITAGVENASVWVDVADTGHGIPGDVLPRIFDPFFTTKQVGEGTGLGLSICMGIVRGLGGEIRVDSTPGVGSRFRVLVPAGAPVEGRYTPPKGTSVLDLGLSARRARVLVVDDEPLFAEAAGRLLAREHDVEVVHGGREALRRVEEGARYDVIVCDLMMPDMTGMALHDALRAAAPSQRDRMILLTGGAFTEAAKEFVERSDLPTLEKAFATEQLLHAVRSRLVTLGGKR